MDKFIFSSSSVSDRKRFGVDGVDIVFVFECIDGACKGRKAISTQWVSKEFTESFKDWFNIAKESALHSVLKME